MPSAATFKDIRIIHPGTYGIIIRSSANGKVAFTKVMVTEPEQGGLLNYGFRLIFQLDRGNGNSGW